jgi:hypothetical protein
VFATGVAVYGIQYAAPEPPEELELLPLEELELELVLLLLLELLEDEELVEVPDEDELLEFVLTATPPQPASSAETMITTDSDAPARGAKTISVPLRRILIR